MLCFVSGSHSILILFLGYKNLIGGCQLAGGNGHIIEYQPGLGKTILFFSLVGIGSAKKDDRLILFERYSEGKVKPAAWHAVCSS